MIHEPALLAVTGELALGDAEESNVLKSPGQLPNINSPKPNSSFSPGGRLQSSNQITQHARTHHALSIIHRPHHLSPRIPSASGYGRVSVIPHDPEAFARASMPSSINATKPAQNSLSSKLSLKPMNGEPLRIV